MAAPRKPVAPAALDAEKSVLGAILLTQSIPREVSEDLFFNPDCARWFRLLQGQASRGMGVDLVSMIPIAQRELGQEEFISFVNLPGQVPSVDALPYWVKLLRKKREERRLHQWARQVEEALKSGDYEKLLALQGKAARTGGDTVEGQPRVQINDRDARSVIEDCWEVLERQHVPVIFQQEGRLVRCAETDHGRVIRSVNAPTLRAMLADVACFVRVYDRKEGRIEEHAGPAPTWVPEGMESLPRKSLPVLESIASAPFFSVDGELVTAPGYHATGKCWLEDHGCVVEKMDLATAKATLQDWLVDFRFADEFDQTNAIALFLLPFVRRMVHGPTPGHLIEASTPGSGKGLLAKVLLLPNLGKPPEATPFAESEEERRKSLMSALIGGRPVALLDNLKGKVDSPVLEGILTSEVWQDRLLGVTGTVYAANKTTWVFTGNNADLSLDMARRCLRIRLDQGVERPYDNQAVYAHPDIDQWTRDNRGKLVSAAVALVQNWLDGGRKPPAKTLGSFESWSRVIGGILTSAGYGGWLEGRDSLIQNADRQGDQLKHFVEAWMQAEGSTKTYTVRLIQIALDENLLSGTLGDGTARSQQTRLAAFLVKARGRVFDVESADKRRARVRIPEQQRDREGAYWVLEVTWL